MNNTNLPEHFRYLIPIVDVLKKLGGSGRSSEVTDLVIQELNIFESEVEETLHSGGSRIKNQIHWARLVLVKNGYLDSSLRGVWNLTEKGFNEIFSEEKLIHLYKTRNKWSGVKKKEISISNFADTESSKNRIDNEEDQLILV